VELSLHILWRRGFYDGMTTECSLHPTEDHFGPDTKIYRCAHLGDRFVIAFRGHGSRVFVDYVEFDEENPGVIVESHYVGGDWEDEFRLLEARMLNGNSPDPEAG